MRFRPNDGVGIVAAPALVRRVKIACEKAGIFDRAVGVLKCPETIVPTTLQVDDASSDDDPDVDGDLPLSLLATLATPKEPISTLIEELSDVSASLRLRALPTRTNVQTGLPAASPFHHAFSELAKCSDVDNIPPDVISAAVYSTIPRWEQHGTFVLFQPGAFDSPPWRNLLDTAAGPRFLSILARHLQASHLAVRAPISRNDVMRRPHIRPLLGTFSQLLDGEEFPECPNEEDFERVFWAESEIAARRADGRQVTLRYVWAPSYVRKRGVALFIFVSQYIIG
jgi:hypothetical protein